MKYKPLKMSQFSIKKKKNYDVCSYDDEELSFDYKKRAVEYSRSGKTKKNRSIESVKHRFKLVNS